MAKLHELLAAEKTPNAAWNVMLDDTLKKFKDPSRYFHGHSKSLKMIEDTPENKNIEAAAREEKPVTTTVFDTLEYALDIYGKAEDLQFQKNATNRKATGTVMWNDQPLLVDIPIDELLGLEARLNKIRELIAAAPTLDASQHWTPDPSTGRHIWKTEFPAETTKTDKRMIPVILHEATKEHPAQVTQASKDIVVGKFTLQSRSGAVTALQKADAIKNLDELIIQIKKARMRANETPVEDVKISDKIVKIILEPFQSSKENHQ